MNRFSNWAGYAVLIFITLIWGTTFTVTKSSLDTVPPLYFLAWRFSLATGGLVIANWRRLGSLTRDELVGGVVVGLALALGYIAQTVGLVYSTAAKGGFITGLSVVLVPLLGAVFFGRRPAPAVYGAGILAAAGLAMLSLDFTAGIGVDRGDLFLLACAFAFAINILLVGHYARRCRVLMLALVQVAFTSLLCWLATWLLESPVAITPSLWLSLVYLAVFATVLALVGQIWGQRRVSSERAALIFALEPVFALVFAMGLLGEHLTAQGAVGSTLIMAGIFLAEFGPRQVKQLQME